MPKSTSEALTYLPGDSRRERAALRWQLARRVLGYLRPYRRQTVLAMGCAVLEAGLALVPIIALKVLIDNLTRADPAFGDIVVPVVASCLAVIALAVIGVASTYLIQTISEGVVFDMRQQLFGHLIGQGTDFYSARRGGDILSRVINDVAVVSNALPDTLVGGLRTGLTAGSTVVLMLVLDWRLALVALLLEHGGDRADPQGGPAHRRGAQRGAGPAVIDDRLPQRDARAVGHAARARVRPPRRRA